MHSLSVTSANIAVSHVLLKTTFFGLHFCRRHYKSIFNHFDVIGPKATEFGKITAITPIRVIQGQRFWYKLKAHMQLPLSD